MFSKVVICVAVSLYVVGAHDFSTLRENSWPNDLITPFSYRTFSPIDIDSSDVKLINAGSPLKLVVGQYESHSIRNTGHSITVSAKPLVSTSVTGGVLGNCVYTFQNMTYFFSGDYKGRASNSLDGIDSPLQARVVFRNSRYPTHCSALNKRDGFAILVFNINVEGYAPCPLFTPFANILDSLRVSGSCTTSPSLNLFQWFDQISTIQHYYAYPGSYVDTNSLYYSQYDSATIIQFPKSAAFYISIPQFAHFQHLLNPKGTQLTNILPTFPRCRRPVVQVCGEVQCLFPTAA